MKVGLILVAGLAAILSVSVFALNDEQKARQVCERVMKKTPTESGKTFESLCEMNTQSVSYWECAEKKVDEGISFAFASNQCKSELKLQ